jgi:hypothetical protein
MANQAHDTALAEDCLTAILNGPNIEGFPTNDPPTPRNPELIKEPTETNGLFPRN